MPTDNGYRNNVNGNSNNRRPIECLFFQRNQRKGIQQFYVKNKNILSKFSSVHEFVNVLIGRQHGLILPQILILPGGRTISVNVFAIDTILAILGCLHVSEKSQDIRIVTGRFPQLV